MDPISSDGILLLHHGNQGGPDPASAGWNSTGRVTVAITPAEEAAPTGRKLLAKLLDLQAAIPAAEGLSQEEIDTALEHERAGWR